MPSACTTAPDGFAARDHQPCHAARYQPLRDDRQRLLDQGTGLRHAEFRLHRFHLFRRGRRIEQHRPCAQQGGRLPQRRGDDVVAAGEFNGSMRIAARPDSIQCATWPLVACEQEPEITAAGPATRGNSAASVRSGNRPARRKFSGTPMATPEPPVISGVVGSRRRRSHTNPRRSIASTTARRTPSASSAAMRARIAGAPAATAIPGDQADLALRLRLQHAHEVGVGHRRQRVMAHAGLRQRHVADEQVAHEDGARVVGECRAGDREFAPSACISASATGPMLPCGVESKVEQYLK